MIHFLILFHLKNQVEVNNILNSMLLCCLTKQAKNIYHIKILHLADCKETIEFHSAFNRNDHLLERAG